MNPPLRRARPLHIALSTLMVVLFVVFYLALASATLFLGAQRDLRTANNVVERIGREMSGVINAEIRPGESAVAMLADGALIAAQSHRERLTQIRPLAAALKMNPSASSVYAGSANGSFVLLRSLSNAAIRASFKAPEEAVFLLQSVDRDRREPAGRFTFFDAAMRELSSTDKPDYQFDPRTRPWFEQASAPESAGKVIQTPPYVFFTTQEIGITLAAGNQNKFGAVGMDLSLTTLSGILAAQKVTESAELVIFDSSGSVLAYRDTGKLYKVAEAGKVRMAAMADLGVPAITTMWNNWQSQSKSAGSVSVADSKLQVDGNDWFYRVERLGDTSGQPLFLGIAAPKAELMADSLRIRNISVIVSLVLVLLMLPVVYFASKAISRPIRDLVTVAGAVERFDFDGPSPVTSRIAEVDNLAQSMTSMKQTLKRFLDISSALSAESNFHRLTGQILRDTISVAEATGGALVLLGADGQTVETAARHIKGHEQDISAVRSHLLADADNSPLEVQAMASGRLQSARFSRSNASHLAIYATLFNQLQVEHVHLIALPLRNRAQEVIGALALSLEAPEDAAAEVISSARLAFIEALSGIAAVAIDNQKLLRDQKALFESVIKLVAGSIDTKSAYSGGHCQRVPELTKMLAAAACKQTEGPFAGYAMSEEDWEALHIAGWLHDCGKLSSPEFVVDKATKLETIYDRIHEVRMRFEVFKRDVEIEAFERALTGLPAEQVDLGALRAGLAQPLAALDDDFRFVAGCNVGGEFMAPEKLKRLKQIAGRRWLRTLDDSLGVSQEELLRRQGTASEQLPVWESLLCDKPEHIFVRPERERIDAGNPWGFKITPPTHLYNRGELYNLSIGRGTLTDEDRYKINEHIVQSIKMLSELPFPKHLSRVPEIAGGHHEKMDGTGYPRRLRKHEMSVEARMMAIADVFEALTAVDRPYKKGKTLSEAIKIMSLMKQDKHIDADLFALFLESGVYLEYAKRYMRQEQIDTVDVAAYVAVAST